jgi:hypothetical protein
MSSDPRPSGNRDAMKNWRFATAAQLKDEFLKEYNKWVYREP